MAQIPQLMVPLIIPQSQIVVVVWSNKILWNQMLMVAVEERHCKRIKQCKIIKQCKGIKQCKRIKQCKGIKQCKRIKQCKGIKQYQHHHQIIVQ